MTVRRNFCPFQRRMHVAQAVKQGLYDVDVIGLYWRNPVKRSPSWTIHYRALASHAITAPLKPLILQRRLRGHRTLARQLAVTRNAKKGA